MTDDGGLLLPFAVASSSAFAVAAVSEITGPCCFCLDDNDDDEEEDEAEEAAEEELEEEEVAVEELERVAGPEGIDCGSPSDHSRSSLTTKALTEKDREEGFAQLVEAANEGSA